MELLQKSADALRATLDHCARHVPLYRGVGAPATGEPEGDALRRFPILTKDRMRRGFPHEFLPAGSSLREALQSGDVQFVGTSGTSGDRVQVLWHQPWWDAQELDGYRLHPVARAAVDRADFREAVLTTPVCSGNLCHVGKLPMADRIEGERTLFLNQTVDPAAWSDAEILRIADELDAFAPHHLEADPAYLAHFVARLERLGRRPRAPEYVDLSYEFPSRRHVATIARAFDCPILDAYGSTECGFVFLGCAAGRWHHNAAWSHVEFLPLPALPGVALLLVTTLGNPWLNLVRFDTGDLVRVRREACPCGAGESALLAIEGRVQDCVVAVDGTLRTVRDVDRALAAIDGLLHYRLVQSGPEVFEIDLVPDGTAAGAALTAGLVGEALVPVLGCKPSPRIVASVPVEASGKFRLCQASHVAVAQRVREGT